MDVLLHLLVAIELGSNGSSERVGGSGETRALRDLELVVFSSENTDLQGGEARNPKSVLFVQRGKLLLDLVTSKKIVLGLFDLRNHMR